MSLYMLNLSVDSIDANWSFVPEDLSINDQESIIELVVEKIFGFENAIAEFEDSDLESLSKKSESKIDGVHQKLSQAWLNRIFAIGEKQKFLDYSGELISGIKRLASPPPKF